MEGESEMKRFLYRSANSTICIAVAAVMAANSSGQQVEIVPFNATWDYLYTAVDDGGALRATDPFANTNGIDFANWPNQGFNTNVALDVGGKTLSWQSGDALFGFGDNGVNYATEFSVPFSGERDATHYFRHEFTTSQEFNNLTLGAMVDDGIVVYLDGQRISGMNSCCKNSANRNYDPLDTPDVPIPYRERATVSNGPCRIEGRVYEEEVAGVTLSPGSHVLAASVHSISANSADMRFDLRLFQNVENEYQGDPTANSGSFSGEWGAAGCGEQSPAWAAGSAPDGPGAIARLKSIPTRDTTIYTDDDKTLGTLVLENSRKYAIAGHGMFEFQTADGSNALIDVVQGDHEFQTVVTLSNNLDVNVASGSSIEFNNDLFLEGNNLTIGGDGGAVEINNNLFADGGAVNAAAGAMIGGGPIFGDVFNTGGTVAPGNGLGVLAIEGDYRSQSADSVLQLELGAVQHDVLQVAGELELSGELRVTLAEGYTPAAGDLFDILEFDAVSGSFDRLSLPALSDGLSWNASGLYDAGQLTVVPEPASAVMLVLAGLGFALIRRW